MFQKPLGPLNLLQRHPFAQHAFRHAGGEIIFHLPNGLQGYMLIDGEDNRINEGPQDVVRDKSEIAGRSTAIVNGLSCMACHKHGMYAPPPDEVRDSAAVPREAKDKVLRLYLKADDMRKLLKDDEDLFLRGLERAIGPFVRVGADEKKAVTEFPEPVSLLASPFLKEALTLEEAAWELGLRDPKDLKAAIRNNRRLSDELGLKPWLNGGTIKRDVWQSVSGVNSRFQEAAAELQRGDAVSPGR